MREEKMKKLCAPFAAICLLAATLPAAAEVKLGVIAGMSGVGTSYGIGIQQGAEMAVKEINDAGGVGGEKIKLVVVDDATPDLLQQCIDVRIAGKIKPYGAEARINIL